MKTYRPGVPLGFTAQQTASLRAESQRVKEAMERPVPDLTWEYLHAEPTKIAAGMEVIADGADWDPGAIGVAAKYRRSEDNTTWELLEATAVAAALVSLSTSTSTGLSTATSQITSLSTSVSSLSTSTSTGLSTHTSQITSLSTSLSTTNSNVTSLSTSASTGIAGKQPLDADLTSWAAITRAAGFDTFATTPSSANLASLLTDETGSGAAVFATAPTLTRPIIAATAFASLPSAASNSGSLAFATDLGAGGTLVRSDGTRWRPINGRTLLKLSSLGSAIGSSETIVLQTQLPAAVLVAGDMLSITFAATKSGTTDSTNWAVRMGTAGTTSDALQTTGNAALMTAAQINGNGLAEFLIASATTTQRLGAQSGTGYFGAATGNTTQAAQTISNISNSLYVSLTLASSGATNTTTLQAGRIELLTP